jgi:hypothetical protein
MPDASQLYLHSLKQAITLILHCLFHYWDALSIHICMCTFCIVFSHYSNDSLSTRPFVMTLSKIAVPEMLIPFLG